MTVGKTNAYYKRLIQDPRKFRISDSEWDGSVLQQLIRGKWEDCYLGDEVQLEQHAACCGVGDIGYFSYKKGLSNAHLDELIAAQLAMAFTHYRYLIYATTVKTIPGSGYTASVPGYRRIVASLKRLGFGVIAEKYKNINTNNTIVILGALNK